MLLNLLFAVVGQGRALLVDLLGASVSDSTVTPDNATARYTVSSDGDEYTDLSAGSPTSINTWLKAGAAGDYEVKWTATGDTAALEGTHPADGTYIDCSTSPFWQVSDTSQVGVALSCTGPLVIRLAAAPNTVLDTATLTLTAHESA